MKHGKKTAFAALLAAGALAFAGCAADGDNGAAEGEITEPEGDQIHVEMVSKGFQHQFWQAVRLGAEQKAEELGVHVNFDGPAEETMVAQQLDMLSAAIDRSPDAIGYASLDPEACISGIEEADARDIPVVYFDAPCNAGDIGQSFAATDGVAAAAVAADHMAELTGGVGKIGIVGHSQTNSTGIERRDGFVDQITAEYPDMEVVDIQYGDGDHLQSADIAKAMLTAHPDLAGLYGTNEGSAIGIVNAANELGLEPGAITIIGFDSGEAQLNAIRDGVMAGAMTQDPIQIGARTVESAVALANGEEVEEYYDTGAYWYDSENIDSEEIAALLYE